MATSIDPKRSAQWMTTEYAVQKNEECYSHVFILSYLVNKLQSRGILVEVLHGYLSFVMVYAVSIIAYTVGEIASRALPPIFTKKKEPHTLLPVVTRCIRVIQ